MGLTVTWGYYLSPSSEQKISFSFRPPGQQRRLFPVLVTHQMFVPTVEYGVERHRPVVPCQQCARIETVPTQQYI